jgi:hypothetical protein
MAEAPHWAVELYAQITHIAKEMGTRTDEPGGRPVYDLTAGIRGVSDPEQVALFEQRMFDSPSSLQVFMLRALNLGTSRVSDNRAGLIYATKYPNGYLPVSHGLIINLDLDAPNGGNVIRRGFKPSGLIGHLASYGYALEGEDADWAGRQVLDVLPALVESIQLDEQTVYGRARSEALVYG